VVDFRFPLEANFSFRFSAFRVKRVNVGSITNNVAENTIGISGIDTYTLKIMHQDKWNPLNDLT
jgi:hypothetical protein